MTKKLKAVSLFLVLMLLLNTLQLQWVGCLDINGKTAKAAGKLTREVVKKFEDTIAVGRYHTAVINSDGTVAAFGYNEDGEIEVSEWTDIVAISAENGHTTGLKSDGTVVDTICIFSECEDIAKWTDIIAVSAGGSHTVGLKGDGTVVADGYNYYGELNVSDWTDIVAISAGNTHTVGLKGNGTVVAAGYNDLGQTNVSGWTDIVSVSAGGGHTVGLKSDGTVVAVGDNTYGQINTSSWTDIVAISAGSNHTVGLKSDGTVVAVGYNEDGEIEVSEWTDIIAISAGMYNTIGLKSDGTLVGIGHNGLGQINITNWTDILAISAGVGHTAGLKSDGTVVAIGNNMIDQIKTGEWRDIIAISAGDWHTLGLKNDGTVAAVGDNEFGQTDVGEWTDIVSISAGGCHTVGLKSDGTVVATGLNEDGQINVGEWKNIVAVSAGCTHTVGLKSDGTVAAIGLNENGQLNVGEWKDIVAISVGFKHTIGLKSDGTVVAVGDNEFGQIDVGKWTDIVAISAGAYHTVGLKSDGTVVAVGDNEYGQIDTGEWTDIAAISAGDTHTVGLKSDRTVVGVGGNLSGQVNFPKFNHKLLVADKNIVKPNDNIKIVLKKNNFYNIINPQISFTGGINLANGQMIKLDEENYEFQYTVKPEDTGIVNASITGTTDLLGKNLVSENIFKVIPLKSISSSKAIFNPGDNITLTAAFYESIKPGFKMSLQGGINLTSTKVTEIQGSNGTKFSLDFTVPNDYLGGSLNVRLHNVETVSGVLYLSYDENNIINDIKPVTGVSLSKTEATLKTGETLSLIATVSPTDATNKNVTWSSSNPSIATVSNGIVTAIGAGTAIITVKTVDGGFTASCSVTVTGNSVINKIRYGGTNRFSTAISVSRAGWTTSDNVVLVNAFGFADALTGVPFAHVKDAPILLTEAKVLTKETNDEIVRLKAKNIYILGGVGVVSQEIENGLKSRGYNVYRIAGSGRFETAIEIGKNVIESSGTKTAILTTAYNYPDALAISSYAAISGTPILYTDPKSFTGSTKNFIIQKGITKIIIPGGINAVSAEIENELKSMGVTVQRIAGSDRYSTAYNIVNTFKDSFKTDVMLATGKNFPDALAGGALAAKLQIPILLVQQNSIDDKSASYIRSKGTINLYVLGGTSVISDDIVNLIKP